MSFLSMAMVSLLISAQATRDSVPNPCPVKSQHESVGRVISMTEILSGAKPYHCEHVTVQGYLVHEFGEVMLYFSKEHARIQDLASAIAIDVGMNKGLSECLDLYVQVDGVITDENRRARIVRVFHIIGTDYEDGVEKSKCVYPWR